MADKVKKVFWEKLKKFLVPASFAFVIGILLFVSLRIYSGLKITAQIDRCNSELKSIAKKVLTFVQTQGEDPESWQDLIKAGILSEIPYDPWGRAYELLVDACKVVSAGPNGKFGDGDDIGEYWIKDLVLMQAYLDDGGTYNDRSDDLLVLVFSKKVGFSKDNVTADDILQDFKLVTKYGQPLDIAQYIPVDSQTEFFIDADDEKTLVIHLPPNHQLDVFKYAINIKAPHANVIMARDGVPAVPSGTPIEIESGTYNKYANVMKNLGVGEESGEDSDTEGGEVLNCKSGTVKAADEENSSEENGLEGAE